MWPTTLRTSSYQLLPDTDNNSININISNIPIWKSWIKPVSLVTFSSVVSVVTAPFVAITNYWKENTKFDFKNGWNNFTINPFIFISSELVNSFFILWLFLKLNFV